ncbi:hypothetical protein C8J56DRAFT_18758 [Mycena floridula]|nr:hypothetical protein C8J56DRAFT_18758 [Mycena floridula]
MFQRTTICLFFLLHVCAVPLIRTVIDPPITSPTAKTIWKVGQQETVTWDTSSIPKDPKEVTNPNGTLVLGFLTSTSENLMLATPLAKGFKLTDGNVTITVPSVVTRDNYIVVLMGSSGNASPKFIIQGTGGTGASSVKSSSASVSTPITNPIPITGSTITGGSTTVTSRSATTTTLSTISSVSSLVSSPASSPASSSSSSAAATSTSTSSSGAGRSNPLHMYYTAIILAVLALSLTL